MAVVAGSRPLRPAPDRRARARGARRRGARPPAQPARLSAHLARQPLRLVPDPDAVPDRHGDRPRQPGGPRREHACWAGSTTSTSWAPASWPAPACRPPASSRPTRSWARSAWRRNYEAILATPMQVHHLLIGELSWIGFRLTTMSTRLHGGAHPVRHPALARWRCSPSRPRCSPGSAFAAPIIGFSADAHQRLRASRRSSASSSTRSSCSAAPSSRSRSCPIGRVGRRRHARSTTAWRSFGARCWTRCRPTWPLHVAYLLVFLAATGYVAYRLLRRRLVK